MAISNDVQTALSSMILSHSGWRGIFASIGGEESKTEEISAAHKIITAGAAQAFAQYLIKTVHNYNDSAPLIITGCDTRPTGKAIVQAINHTLEELS